MADESVSSPKFTPWSHVVRGESEAMVTSAAPSPTMTTSATPVKPMKMTMTTSSVVPSAVVESVPVVATVVGQSDTNGGGSGGGGGMNVGKGKKAAWNKPNEGGGVGGSGEVEIGGGSSGGLIMGAVMWPALSESAKNSPKSSTNLLKDLSGGGGGGGSGDIGSILSGPGPILPQGPLIASSPKKLTPSYSNANANPSLNPSINLSFNRQKSMKRNNGGGGGGNGSSNSGYIQPPPSPPPPILPLVETPPNEVSPRDQSSNNNWENGRRSGGYVGNNGQTNQQRQFRRSNSGPHQRGNHGGRREPNLEWSHRSFNGRDYQMQQQQQGAHRSFMAPMSPGTAPYINGPYIRPFANPMAFSEMGPPVYYVTAPVESMRGMPLPFGMYLPVPLEVQLRATIMKQIDYYFSHENLLKDIYLRRNMDEEGWVPLSLIAGFSRVKMYDISTILDAVQASTVVETMDGKIRRRNDWMNYLGNLLVPAAPPNLVAVAPPAAPGNLATAANPFTPEPQIQRNQGMLSNQMENVQLAEGSANGKNKSEEKDNLNDALNRRSSSDFN